MCSLKKQNKSSKKNYHTNSAFYQHQHQEKRNNRPKKLGVVLYCTISRLILNSNSTLASSDPPSKIKPVQIKKELY